MVDNQSACCSFADPSLYLFLSLTFFAAYHPIIVSLRRALVHQDSPGINLLLEMEWMSSFLALWYLLVLVASQPIGADLATITEAPTAEELISIIKQKTGASFNYMAICTVYVPDTDLNTYYPSSSL